MSLAFWNSFGNDYAENCLRWKHRPAPAIHTAGGWMSEATANPDLLEFGGKSFLYFRGTGENRDRIGVAEVTFSPFAYEVVGAGPVVAPEGKDVLDPAAVVFQGKVFLYYSQLDPDVIGLAISDDGVRFDIVGPVLEGRAPEVVVREGRLYLIDQLFDENGGYELRLYVSDDGRQFEPAHEGPIFRPKAGDWDALSVVTARVWEADGWYWMLYGGSAYLPDEPDHFGLARSSDLIEWERHPGNPIFGCGPKGAPDGGAMWFPAFRQTKDEFVLLYEGCRGKAGWDNVCAICIASMPRG